MEELIKAVEAERRKDQLIVLFSAQSVVYDNRRNVIPAMDRLNELGVRWITTPGIEEDWLVLKIKRRATDEV
jgi:hypothetical protein